MEKKNSKTSTRITTPVLVKMAMLIAISIILVLLIHIPIFPVVSFLEYDPADIPILIGALAYGPVAGLIITVVTAVIQGFTVSASSGVYGIIMHIVATVALCVVSSAIYSKKRTRKTCVIGLICGILAMTVVMIGANLIVTPAFTGMSVSAVWALMPWIALFNLIKATINSVVTFIIYPMISGFLRRDTWRAQKS